MTRHVWVASPRLSPDPGIEATGTMGNTTGRVETTGRRFGPAESNGEMHQAADSSSTPFASLSEGGGISAAPDDPGTRRRHGAETTRRVPTPQRHHVLDGFRSLLSSAGRRGRR